jgi:DNA-binding NarL/FixJ family response regulator
MRVLIAEDAALFREGLARLLSDAGYDVVATACTATEILPAVRRESPDFAVIDIRMPPDLTDDGARAAREVRAEYPDLGILLLSQHIETRHSVELVSSGGFGYLLKDRVLNVDDFLGAVERVALGESVLDPDVVRMLLGAAGRNDPLRKLTGREREVLELMAEGLSNHAIALRLFLTERTVESHISSIMRGLGLFEGEEYNRRVKAVLTFLGSRGRPGGPESEPH